MAKFVMRQLPDKMNGSAGKMYPKIVSEGEVSLDAMAQEISSKSTFTPGDVKGVVGALLHEMEVALGRGHTVRVDGLGLFRPTLSVDPAAPEETASAESTHRTGASVRIGGVSFCATKGFIGNANTHSQLERLMPRKGATCNQPTPEQRRALIAAHFATNATLTVKQYEHLTHLSHAAAVYELRNLSQGDDALIEPQGYATHRHYTLRTP